VCFFTFLPFFVCFFLFFAYGSIFFLLLSWMTVKKRKTRDTLKTKEKWGCCNECKRSATTSTWSFFSYTDASRMCRDLLQPLPQQKCVIMFSQLLKKTVHTKKCAFHLFLCNFLGQFL
jgi:hypothetical protein